MTAAKPGNAAFARVLTALRPYLGDLVVAGGWATASTSFTRRAVPRDSIRS